MSSERKRPLVMSRDSVGCRVWRQPCEYFQSTCLKRSVTFPQSVLVWGYVSAAGVGRLCFLRTTVNTVAYQDVLDHFLIPYTEDKFEDGDFVFQQDHASPHSARSTIKWLKKKDIQVFDWPVNSPDARPIENLWGIIKRKLRTFFPTNLQELKVVTLQPW